MKTFTASLTKGKLNTANLVELLQHRAEENTGRGFIYVDKNQMEINSFSFCELDRKAKSIAANLKIYCKKGDRILLLYPQGLEYVSAFFGCLYAGLIAVPAYPPRNNRNLKRLDSIIKDSSAKVALTNETSVTKISKLFDEHFQSRDIKLIATDNISDEVFDEHLVPEIKDKDIAFLQYTSGSTGNPRGVMVSHENLIHNSILLKKAFNYDPQSICISWLPMYHDMGLIGGIIQPLYGGYSCYLMSPTSFLQSPYRWLKLISDKGGTISGSPNFGYELCIRKITEEQKDKLDLNSWKVAFNGAEPIQTSTMTKFAEKFSNCGFNRRAFFPCYGLAEATLFVSGGPFLGGVEELNVDVALFEKNTIKEATRNSTNIRKTVASGKIYSEDQEVIIVDSKQKKLLSDNKIGEVWIKGKSVAEGYWNNPKETAKTFNLSLAGSNTDRYLATGDLGFIRDNKLFISGRIKDLIIIRGVNHYPQDIEQTILSCNKHLNPNSCAAFSLKISGEENLHIVVEVRYPKKIDLDKLCEDIHTKVVKFHGIETKEILVTKINRIPKTTSGKIQRKRCRKKYLDAELPITKKWSLNDNLQDNFRSDADIHTTKNGIDFAPHLIEKINSSLSLNIINKAGLEKIKLNSLDSLKVTELIHLIENEFDLRLSFSDIASNNTLADLFEKNNLKNLSKVNDIEIKNLEIESTKISYGQKGFWFLHQLYDRVSPDNICVTALLGKNVNVENLEFSLSNILERHSILRGFYDTGSGELTFQTRSQDNVLDIVINRESNVKDFNQLISDEISRPLDLENKLFRFVLYENSLNEKIILLKFHHSIVDFWSLQLIAGELTSLYNSYQNQEIIKLPTPKFQYKHYSLWEKEFVKSDKGQEALTFWKQKLDKPIPILSLPFEKNGVKKNKFHGKKLKFEFDPETTSKLKDFSSANNATLFTVLLASYYSLIYRYTEQSEQVIGVPFSGRNSAKWAESVGYFVNLVPMRLKIEEDDNFLAILKRLSKEILCASDYQNYPFHLLVDKIQPERITNKSPIFQTMFVFQNQHKIENNSLAAFSMGDKSRELNLGDLTFKGYEVEHQSSQFEISIYIVESDQMIKGSIEYSTDFFVDESLQSFIKHWNELLLRILEEPQTKLNHLPLINKEEISEMIIDDQKSFDIDHSNESSIHQIFERQVEKTPDETALVFEGKNFTYEEINRKANQLARFLRLRGITCEDLVGLYLPRTEDLVISILAVFKSGGAYVPLDINYPKDRLAHISKDAGIKYLITQDRITEEWAENISERINLKRDWNDIKDLQIDNLDDFPYENKLAYVIYTSGSTGKPKGVAIEHKSVKTFINWSLSQFSKEELKGTLASTSINFDLSIFELLVPICCGAKIILTENALFLSEVSSKDEVTLINTVPSAMVELVRLNSIPKKVKIINLAGELLSRSLVSTLYRKFDAGKVFNLYGPSEDTTYSTVEFVKPENENINIGFPITKTNIYLLNDALQLVPFGMTGEIFIGGHGLARGYFNKSNLTAEKFLPNPFSEEKGQRMYRTGDRARYLPNGKIEFLGRVDNQVKVRGFRIELGEIETILSSHTDIEEAIVITSKNKNDELQLVGFLISNTVSEKVSIDDLRSFLKKKLPEYMIPQYFAWLESFPLTPNKKIDRQAFQDLEVKFERHTKEIILPRNLTENEVANMWQEVLSSEKIGINENFFELGGTSLQITQISSRIKEKYKIEFSLKEIYECYTIEQQAILIDEKADGNHLISNETKIKPIARKPRKANVLSK